MSKEEGGVGPRAISMSRRGWDGCGSLFLFGVVLTLCACEEADNPNRRPPDPPGYGVPTQEATQDPLARRLSHLVEEARIGDLDGRAAFGQITAIAVDALRRVYVADVHHQDVRVFDSAGAYVRTLAGEGPGPGELFLPKGLTWQDDATLWIRDGNNQYSVYDTSGAHLADHWRLPLGSLAHWPARFDAGRLIEAKVGSGYRLVAIDPDAPFAPPPDTFPYPLEDVPLDQWRPSFTIRSPGSIRLARIPFTQGFVWSLDGNGGVWIGNTREYELVRRSLRGDTLQIVRHGVSGIRVSREERRMAIEALGTGAERLDHSRIPERKPFFRMIVPVDDGGVWLFREGEATNWFIDIVDANGRIVASLDLPRAPDLLVPPVVRSGELWMASRGPLDLPLVFRFSVKHHGTH